MTRINRKTKRLREFTGHTHEDVYGVLRVLVGLRRASGRTQKQVATEMGVSAPVLCRLETADSRLERVPTLSQLQSYARAVGAEVRLAVHPPDTN